MHTAFLRSALRILMLCMLAGLQVSANSANMDSLRQDYINSPSSVNKVEQGLILVDQFWLLNQIDSADIYTNEVLKLAERLNHAPGIAAALLSKALIDLRHLKPYDQVITLMLRSLRIFEEIGDTVGIGQNLMQLGVVNYSLGNYENAARYLERGLSDGPDKKWHHAICRYLLGLCYSETGRYEEAHALLEGPLEDYIQGDPDKQALLQGFIGKLLYNEGKYDESLEQLQRTVHLQQMKGLTSTGPLHAFLSSTFLKLGMYDSVIHHGQIALSLIARSSGALYIQEALYSMQDAYGRLGQMDMAYTTLHSWHLLSDSIASSKALERIASQKVQYEYDKEMMKERARRDLEQSITRQELARQRLVRNISLGGALALLLLAVVFFRQRLRISKEKAQSDRLLLNILPEEVANELKLKGQADARDHEHVSILFTDFQAFTRISEHLRAKELVAEMNHCFKAFDEICERYGIEKIKTIGDSFMAAGGLPIQHDDSVLNTVLAALDMADFVVKRKAQRDAEGKIGFEMRSGVNTGNVVAGIIGVKKFQYDVWGDTVNTASRMETYGEPGAVNISESTYLWIKEDPHFEFEQREEVDVKGKGRVRMYFVRRAS